jgi:4,5-DOPA dioxygenase extradiol
MQSSFFSQEDQPTVTSGANPSLIYDYYGFSPEAYTLQYPAKGSPKLARRVVDLLSKAGFDAKEDPQRGYDHGVFVPLKLAYPSADIPIVQLSLLSCLDASRHVRMGQALAPLRNENVLILGSGMSFHRMKVFQAAMAGSSTEPIDHGSVEFDRHLNRVLIEGDAAWEGRRKELESWASWPYATHAHPREEHLLPLMVIFGAADGDFGKCVYSDNLLGAKVSSFCFG